MPLSKITILAAFTVLFTVQAQYTIDPNMVPIATRSKWCESQKAVCPLLCYQLPGASGTTASNTCDPATLSYSCVCGNGLTPNATEYSQTVPYFTCTEWQNECVTNCGAGNNACASSCRQDHPCGALDPQRYNLTSSTAAAATATGSNGATGTGGAVPTVYNGLGNGGSTTGSGAGSTSASQSAGSALDLSRSYGILVVMTGLFAGFALVL